MRDLAAVLRSELKRLEAELAADPRLQKAQKIRELLMMYGEPCHTPAVLTAANSSALQGIVGRRGKVDQIRFVIKTFMRSKGSATLARSRLVEMAQTNHWPSTAKVSIRLDNGSPGRPLHPEKVLPPSLDAPSAASATAPTPPANYALETGHS